MSELMATREAYGKTLIKLARQNPKIVVLDADLSKSTTSYLFAKEFPERFFNIGLAEQNMISLAAGLSTTGKIVFVSSFGVFAAGRVWDQIRISICYSNANVKIVGTHGGITVGEDGATHQALEEISLMRAIPQMTVIVPVDAIEAVKAIEAVAELKGPAYLRLGREKIPVITQKETPFIIGKGKVFHEGDELTIIATGIMVEKALKTAEIFKEKGIYIRVINLHTIKPIDEEIIIKAAKETKAIITAEEHTIMGGLGSAVSSVVVKNFPVPMEIIGIDDKFGESGSAKELLKYFGLTVENLIIKVEKIMKRKNGF